MLSDLTPVDDSGPRRLLAAILLRACADASKGDRGALRFLNGDDSAAMARALELRKWPPSPDMLCSHKEMKIRSKILNAAPREDDMKPEPRESSQLDFSSGSTHTSGNRTKRAGQVLLTPNRL